MAVLPWHVCNMLCRDGEHAEVFYGYEGGVPPAPGDTIRGDSTRGVVVRCLGRAREAPPAGVVIAGRLAALSPAAQQREAEQAVALAACTAAWLVVFKEQ